jgi:hypothetical protein
MSTGDRLVYTDDPCGQIKLRIEALGSVERLLIVMFDGQPYASARLLSKHFAGCFGMEDAEFMRHWRKLRFAAANERTAAANARAAARNSGPRE